MAYKKGFIMALSLKQKLFDYFAQRHFDLMTPEQRARFDDYAKNEDFLGHMKHWNDNYDGAMLPDLLSAAVAGAANDHQLTNDEWEELYDAFQEAFQAMDSAKTPSVGFEGPYKKATKDFIAKYFGDSSKTFTTTSATPFLTDPTTGLFTQLANFLDPRGTPPTPDQINQYSALKNLLSNNLKTEVFSDGLDYDGFIDKLRKQKYNTDLNFRKKIESVFYYIKQNGPRQGDTVPRSQDWPKDIGYQSNPVAPGVFTANNIDHFLTAVYDPSNDPDNSTNPWYALKNKKLHINQFKNDFSEIFDTLLTKSSIRTDFLGKAPDKISEPLTKAIELTDYENKDSKDFLPAKYPDEKNWMQQFEDWKNDTYEDYLRKFTNPSRGTRIFFSPWAQNIIKAFDKVKIKPTDGLEGILAKKDDISKKLVTSKNASDHFKWFTDNVEKLKNAGMGKAVEGALRNGAQMRHLVSGLIAEAVEQGKEKEAKTALEILSVAKYGLSSSRTMDAINKTDMTIFSDKGLSWNKNEGIKTVTGALDKTIKFGIQAAGYAATGAYNFIQHRRTKIGNDIRNNPILKKAHDKWETENQQALQNKQGENQRMHVDMKLDTLAHGNGLSGRVIANDTDLQNAETALAAMAVGAPGYDDLKSDIDLYKDSKSRKDAVTNWDAEHQDKFRELIAYWDMLESVGKSHSFTLGSMSIKRKAYIKDFARGTSQAQNDFNAYLAQYGNLRTA